MRGKHSSPLRRFLSLGMQVALAPLALAAACSLIAVAPGHAQEEAAPAAPAGRPAWLPKPEPCPASGYAAPRYGLVGRNGGDGPAATEAASPCVPQAVQDAAEAVGMARAHGGSPWGLKNVVTVMFAGSGTFAVDGAKPQTVSRVDVQIHYGLPAARVMITSAAGAKPDIRVFNDGLAWTEVSEGVGGAAAPAAAAHEELVLTKLTPFGALWSEIEAEAHVKVMKVKGQTVLVGASPYDGIEVTTTLDDKNFPVSVSVKDGKNVYGATFANYHKNTWGQKDYSTLWEPDYGVTFPTKITWTKNGRPYADLTVNEFKSNAYVVFPVPDGLTPGTSKVASK